MAKTIIPIEGQQNDSAEQTDLKERRALAWDAAGQIEALTDMLERELDHGSSEFEHYLLPQMLRRIHSVNSVVLSVLSEDDGREIEEMRGVIRG